MNATEQLKHEHQVILKVVEAASREAQSIKAGGKVDEERVGKLVEFFRNFADHCHHAKEEDRLFTRMEQRGVPADMGPIAELLGEHEEARQRISAIAEALPNAAACDAEAIGTVREHLAAYADLLGRHIDKEDNVLYPMADQVLSAADQQ